MENQLKAYSNFLNVELFCCADKRIIYILQNYRKRFFKNWGNIGPADLSGIEILNRRMPVGFIPVMLYNILLFYIFLFAGVS